MIKKRYRQVLIAAVLICAIFMLKSVEWFQGSLTGELELVEADQNYLDPSAVSKEIGKEEPTPAIEEESVPTIAVYKGPGYWDTGAEAVINFLDTYGVHQVSIDACDINDNLLDGEYDAIWFPGGWTEQYWDGINHDEKIIEYVSAGGIYIGICAGAYYFCGLLLRHEKLAEYSIMADESLNELIDWGSMTPVESPAENFEQNFCADVTMMFCGGPFFRLESGEGANVMAKYVVNNEAAAVHFNLGAGEVMLIGPHPELGYCHSEDSWNVTGGGGARWGWLESFIKQSL